MTLCGLFTLCILCCVQLINCSHFRGAIFTWTPEPDNNVEGHFTVRVRFRISWRRTYGGHFCDDTIIKDQTLIGDSSVLCLRNESGSFCNNQLYYYCTDYSLNDDWTSGRNDFAITSESEKFNLTFSGGGWVHAGSWNFVTMVDLTPRPDNEELNSSPTVEFAPVINLQQECSHTITLPVSDVDGDTVRCRWAIGTECADVCDGTSTALPAAYLDKNTCSITYTADVSHSNQFYAVALQVEDFIDSSSEVPLSSIPIQFLVYVYESQDSMCANEPEFVTPTPENGQCFVIDVGEAFNVNITVKGAQNFSAITTASAVGMTHSSEIWWRDSLWYYMSLIVTWTPTEEDAEQDHTLCFYARDVNGIYNVPRCINVPVAVPAPNPTSVERVGITNTWTLKFDRTFSLPDKYVDIIVIETETNQTVFTMGTENSADVLFDPDQKLVRITISHGLNPAKDYHVIVPEGLVRRVGNCNALSPKISDEMFWKIEIDCGNIDPINNGVFRTPNGTDHPHAVVFECKQGYKLYGDDRRQCLVNGVWGGEDPKCEIPVCSVLLAPDNGVIMSSNGTRYTSTIYFKCNVDFMLMGNEMSQCTIDAVWSSPVPTCIIKVDIGSPCTTSDICRPYRAQCINSTCVCKTGIYNRMADTCDAMNLYPFGLDNGDVVIDNTDDFCIPIDYQYPIFDEVPKLKHIYVCSNGIVSVGQEYLDTWPSMTLGDNKVLAPFFADTNGGTLNYRKIDKLQDKNITGLYSEEVKLVESIVAKLASMKSFQTAFILFATWNKVRPVEAIFDTDKESTFQLVLVTDGSHTFAFFIYGHGIMQWSLKSNSKIGPPVWIGYSSLPKYNYTNIYSFTPEVSRMDMHAIDQGISGLSFNRLTSTSPRQQSNEVKCMNWYHANRHLKEKANNLLDELPNCPCDRKGLFVDPYFVVEDEVVGSPYICAIMKQEPFGKTCCYGGGKRELLVEEQPNAGGVQLYSQESNPKEHLINDIDAKKVCCSSPRFCHLYYELHPIGKCNKKSTYKIGSCFGDPHFITLDGKNYTFNGLGEYTLLDINNTDVDTGVTTTFDLQARTDRAIREDGTLSYATRFRGFAAMDHLNASFHIELNDAQDGYTLFANGADLSLNYRGASGVRSFNHTSTDGNIVLYKQQNVLVVLFTHTEISLNVTIGVKMLSLTMTIPEQYKTLTRGLFGNFDDDPENEFFTPNGEARPHDMSEEELFNYAQLWEINPDKSAFIYSEGKNHSHYHNSSYIPQFLMNADNQKVREAYAVCKGIENTQCVFDYVFTEDTDVADDTKGRERKINYIRKTNDQTIPTVDVCDMVFVNKGEKATCGISIGDGPGVQVNVTKTSPHGQVTFDQANNIVSFTIEETTPDIISVTVVNGDERSAEANITVALCTGCTGHGECIQEVRDDDNQTTHFKYQVCKCEPQYEGIDCQFEVDGCKASPCSSLRNCTTLTALQQIAMNVSHICGPCPEGFEDVGTKCKDIDECDIDENYCQQICVNNAGSFECLCYHGYRMSSSNSYQCLDINECDEALHNCSHLCSNAEGNYSCSCFENYVFNETTGDCVLDGNIDVCAVEGLDCSNTSGCTFDVQGNAICFCVTGQTLSDDGTSCSDIDECQQHVCSQLCVNTHGSFNCMCYPGYYLTDGECSQCVFPHWGINCENECTCSSTTTIGCDPAFGCICSPGWQGDLCDVDIDECEEYPCSSTLQTCENIHGSYQCACVEGYELSEDKHTCADIDECSRPDLHNCNQTCTNHIGGYSCGCEEGFVLYDKTMCRDIDDCDVGTSNCEQLCDSGGFFAGSYNCYCHYGYLINDNRRTCRKDPNVRDSCEDNNLKCSHFCKPDRNPKESKCQCMTGYKLAVDNQTCLDVNECSDSKLNKCDTFAECYNTEGSYTCECPVGTMLANNQRNCQECDAFHYGKDCAKECSCIHGTCNPVTGCQCYSGWSGEHCNKDNDECALQDCTEYTGMECRNIPGSFVCQCKAGYIKNGTGICSDINECDSSKLSQCDQKCVNTQGSYRCECGLGFKFVNRRCEDLDECNGISRCDHYCNNTIGSYRCTCREGFKLDTTDRKTCKPEKECTKDNITYCEEGNASCVMIDEQPECICYKGYEKESDVCVDIKECELHSPCQHECNELDGGFQCLCNDGYYLLDDGVGCQECSVGFFGLNCNTTCDCDIDNTATCDPVNGSCVCKAGWGGERCNVDKNECEDSADVCVDYSTCMNTNGSYICTCDEGYFKTGFGECEVCDPQRFGQGCAKTCTCDMEHTLHCDSITGSCECMEGWEGENCTENTQECEVETICSNKPHSECVDTLGSYACQCKDGYASLNGHCNDIDECFEGTANCEQDCVNSEGGFTCQCYAGYEGYWNDCYGCSDNTFGLNCSETCTCNITNSLDTVQTCIPTNGTCVCRDEWTGTSCNEDVDECVNNDDICEDMPNTGCYNTVEGYSCLCLRGFSRINTEGPCEEEVEPEVLLPVGWTSLPLSMSLAVPLPPNIDLGLGLVFDEYKQKLLLALKTFTQRYTDKPFRITITDIRKGSIEVDYEVSYDGNSNGIAEQLAYAAIDLAAGQEIEYDGENVSIKSTQFEKGTDACFIYINTLHNCNTMYECVLEEGIPVCRRKLVHDNLGLILGLTFGLGFTILIVIGLVFCCRKLREETIKRKLSKTESMRQRQLQEEKRSGTLEGWQYDGRRWSPIIEPDHVITKSQTKQHSPNRSEQYRSSWHGDNRRSKPRDFRSTRHGNMEDFDPKKHSLDHPGLYRSVSCPPVEHSQSKYRDCRSSRLDDVLNMY